MQAVQQQGVRTQGVLPLYVSGLQGSLQFQNLFTVGSKGNGCAAARSYTNVRMHAANSAMLVEQRYSAAQLLCKSKGQGKGISLQAA
jgi:hypothetical protein